MLFYFTWKLVLFESFLYALCRSEQPDSEKGKKQIRIAKKLDLVKVNILYLEIYKFILLDMVKNM